MSYIDHTITAPLRAEISRLNAEIASLRTQAVADAARIAELERAQNWQPIDSAPRDGTDILVFCGEGDLSFVTVARWDEDRHYWYETWVSEELHPPTHWQPLPLAPESTK